MGVFDKILGRKKADAPERKPDFSRVRTGSESTLGERPSAATERRPESSGAAAPAAAGARTYEVRPGDSLSRIAQRFYGDGNQWPRIHEANRDQIKDPDLIYPGQKLVIP
ncbi:MAG TPA: LysM peptidoglycan-binding domain-containing protein [Gemmatimonadota bacterium]|jgi:nucleoid-associated protein YgaU